nr:glycosyltransferase [Liquorilactobacillus satsumensis]
MKYEFTEVYVLQIGMTPNPGGIEAYVMNLYRKIDRNKVQFDFIDWCGKEDIAFGDEIKRLGGEASSRFPVVKKITWGGTKERLTESWLLESIVTLTVTLTHSATFWELRQLTVWRGLFLLFMRTTITSKKGYSWLSCSIAYTNHMSIGKSVSGWHAAKVPGEWMFPHRKFRVIADAIETAAFKYSEKTRQAARHKLSLENRLVIGSVARFGPQKNLLFLVDVFHKICEVEKQAVLMLVGTGVQEPLLRQRVHQYGLGEKVLFLGARHDTASLMQAMDLMIAPFCF